MKTILLTLALWLLACAVSADTLYVADLGHTRVYVDVAQNIDRDVLLASGSLQVGNLYIDKIARVDSTTMWIGCEDYYLAYPIIYDLSIVVHWPDLDGSGISDISDLVKLVDYMFLGG